jgi:hypothetical protein
MDIEVGKEDRRDMVKEEEGCDGRAKEGRMFRAPLQKSNRYDYAYQMKGTV